MLYKQLNEKRTQGEWVKDAYTVATGVNPEDQTIADFDPNNFPYPTVGDTDKSKCSYNAAYTALAVNNLHHLAEALYEINAMCADAKSKEDINIGKIASISIKALARIS